MGATHAADAASFQVSPVSLEIPAGGATATVTIANNGTTPLNVQIRAFRWTQTSGEESLSPTEAVAVSPPMASLAPGVEYTVRVVRTATQPITGTESYRLLVDELPDRKSQQTLAIKLLVRYSIPVFFYGPESTDAKVSWRLERDGGRVFLAAVNQGDRQLRVADLKLSEAGSTVSFGSGLLGYVLGNSKMRWPAQRAAFLFGLRGHPKLSAQTNLGAIHAEPSLAREP